MVSYLDENELVQDNPSSHVYEGDARHYYQGANHETLRPGFEDEAMRIGGFRDESLLKRAVRQNGSHVCVPSRRFWNSVNVVVECARVDIGGWLAPSQWHDELAQQIWLRSERIEWKHQEAAKW